MLPTNIVKIVSIFCKTQFNFALILASGVQLDPVPAVGVESDGVHQHGSALHPPHHTGQLCGLVQVHHEHQVPHLQAQDRP